MRTPVHVPQAVRSLQEVPGSWQAGGDPERFNMVQHRVWWEAIAVISGAWTGLDFTIFHFSWVICNTTSNRSAQISHDFPTNLDKFDGTPIRKQWNQCQRRPSSSYVSIYIYNPPMALHHHSHLEAKNKHHLLLGKPTFIDMNNLWIARIYNPKLYLLHPYIYIYIIGVINPHQSPFSCWVSRHTL